ncbi:MAG: DNA-3-methyladenine glycosylase family protein [Candidatus Thorarchaeota archaeon]|jgi:N-glycosylase/DNA lyase
MRELVVEQFDLVDTLECGQTFSWIREGPGYVNPDIGQVVYVEQRGNTLYYETSEHDVDLQKLFRLNDSLSEIQEQIARDGIMKESIQFAPGLRVVSDEFFPCLISFLCSIRNNIPNIRKFTQSIRREFGPMYSFHGTTYNGFPSPEDLSRATEDQLRALGLDWRANFIVQSTDSVLEGDIDSGELLTLSYDEAHTRLKSLHGVGDKVADCVCLFSLGFLEAFPIDVWIERVIQNHYGLFTTTGKSYGKKSEAARNYFGEYAGYAQEYLYYFTRTGGQKPRR